MLVLTALLTCQQPDESQLHSWEGTVSAVNPGQFWITTPDRGEVYFPVEKRTRYFIDGREVRFSELKVGQRAVGVWNGRNECYTVEVRIKTR